MRKLSTKTFSAQNIFSCFLVMSFFLLFSSRAEAASCSLGKGYFNCWICDVWQECRCGTRMGSACASKHQEKSDRPFTTFQSCVNNSCSGFYGCDGPVFPYTYSKNICMNGRCVTETRTGTTRNTNFCSTIGGDTCNSNAQCSSHEDPITPKPTPTPKTLRRVTPTPIRRVKPIYRYR